MAKSQTHIRRPTAAPVEAGDRSTGKIKKLVTDKGFGFLIEDVTLAEFFFHQSEAPGATLNGLREGMKVEFQPMESPKGPRAHGLVVI